MAYYRMEEDNPGSSDPDGQSSIEKSKEDSKMDEVPNVESIVLLDQEEKVGDSKDVSSNMEKIGNVQEEEEDIQNGGGKESKTLTSIKKDTVVTNSNNKNEDVKVIEAVGDLNNENAENKEEYVELDSIVQELEACVEEESKKVISKLPNKISKTESQKNENAGRCIWVKNINPMTTASRLKLDLSKYGKVINAKIVTNGEKYYGYALMEKEEETKVCIEKLNGIKMSGYVVEISSEAPQKTIKVTKKTSEKKLEGKRDEHRNVKKSIRDDPLTLKVRNKKSPKPRSRSRSRKRILAKKKEEESRLRRQKEESKKREEELRIRRQREETLFLKRQREQKLQLEMEKRKLDYEKKQLEKEKINFLRLQRKLENDRRAQEAREKMLREKEQVRKRSKSPRNWGHTKRSPHRNKIAKSLASTICDNRLNNRHKRKSNSPVKQLGYNRNYCSPKRDKNYRRDNNRAAVPPPPPRLSNPDLGRSKAEPWKADIKKIKADYYKEKENFSSIMGNVKKDSMYEVNYPEKRYRDERNSFIPKYIKEEDKYKENKKRLYEQPCKETASVRSEIYHPSQRHYPNNEPQRRFDVSYPPTYNDRYHPTTNLEYQPQHFQNNIWNRPALPKEYTISQNKNFHQDHSRYEDFNKRPSYFQPRKY